MAVAGLPSLSAGAARVTRARHDKAIMKSITVTATAGAAITREPLLPLPPPSSNATRVRCDAAIPAISPLRFLTLKGRSRSAAKLNCRSHLRSAAQLLLFFPSCVRIKIGRTTTTADGVVGSLASFSGRSATRHDTVGSAGLPNRSCRIKRTAKSEWHFCPAPLVLFD